MKVDLAGSNIKERFESESVEFGISKEAHGIIMKYLSELYDDPTLAAVREPVSNAMDAHIRAGNSDPVQITVASPNHPTPFFEITDFGSGMSREILEEVFTQYGISTKNEDDEAIGGFGLGCKAPFAIEDRFYIETTQDGTTIVAEAFKKNNGKFALDFNDVYESDKPNGTTIRINLEKTGLEYFRGKVETFLKYVDPKKYTLKTTSPSDTLKIDYILSDTEKYVKISETEDFTVYANLSPHYYDNPTIIMGDVAYKFQTPDSILRNSAMNRDALKVVVVAPIGSVTITTSRENLQDTKLTKTFLEKMYLQYEKDVSNYFQTFIDEADTPREVYSRKRRANAMVHADYTYKGEPIVSTYTFENINIDFVSKRQGGSPYKDWRTNVPLAGTDTIFFVLPDETPESKEGAITRAYNAFLKSKDLDSAHFYFLPENEPEIDSWWVSENPYIHYINKGDILTVASEYRKEQRRINGGPANRRTGKVKYSVVNNVLGEIITADFLQDIEYPDIETGISYITMEDAVAFGLCKSEREPINGIRGGLKRFLDFFEFEGELLVLDTGKKEETMVKRTNAEKFEPDFLGLESKFEACENHALSKLSLRANFIDRVYNHVGQELFDQLMDPRFVSAVPSLGVESEMTDREYETTRSFIMQMFQHGYNDYFHKNNDAIYELKEKFRSLGMYWWENQKTNELYRDVNKLEENYYAYISVDITSVHPELLVKIYNTIYDDYLDLTNS